MVHSRSKLGKERKKEKMKDNVKAKQKLRVHVKSNIQNSVRRKLNVVCHQNQLLKEAFIEIKRRQLTTNKFCRTVRKMMSSTKLKNSCEAKRALLNFLCSIPAVLMESNINLIKETNLEGVFGKVSVVSLKNIDNLLLKK